MAINGNVPTSSTGSLQPVPPLAPGGLPSTNLLDFRFPEAFRVLSPAVGARAERPVNLKRWTGRVVIQPARGAETL